MDHSIEKQADTSTAPIIYKLILLVTVLTATLVVVLDSTMINVALPSIIRDTGASIAQISWVSTAYFLAMTGLLIAFGRISESTGRVRMLAAGLAVFSVSALVSGLAGSFEQLLLFRLIQGIGASAIAGTGIALLFETFSPGWKGTAMGCIVAVTSIGALIGPVFSGYLVTAMGWQSLFIITASIGFVLVVCAVFCLKIPEARSTVPIDWIGLTILTVSIVSLTLSLFLGSDVRLISLSIAGGIFSAVFLGAFILWKSRRKESLLRLQGFGNKKFTLPLASMASFSLAIQIVLVFIPSYLIYAAGFGPMQLGLLFALVPLSTVIPAIVGGVLYDILRWKYLGAAGILIAAIGCLLMGYSFLTGNYGLLGVGLMAIGVGGGVFGGQNTAEILGGVQKDRFPSASGILVTLRNLATSFAMVVFVLYLTISGSPAGYPGAGTGQSIGIILLLVGVLCLAAAVMSGLRNA